MAEGPKAEVCGETGTALTMGAWTWGVVAPMTDVGTAGEKPPAP